MALDLSDILSSVNAFDQQSQSAAQGLFDIGAQTAVSHSQDASLDQQMGTNNVIINNAKLSADFATQQARLKGAHALGTDLNDQGELLTGLSSNILDLMKQRDQVSQQIKDKQSVSLFDDPLQYIWNQITVGDDINKHDAIQAQLKEQEDNMAELNKQTQQTAITQNALLAPLTQAGITAANENILVAAQQKMNADSRAALAANAKGVQDALKVSNEDLNAKFNYVNTVKQAENIDIAHQHLALAQEEFDWRKQEKTIADAARNKQTSIENYTMGIVNSGLRTLGYAEIPLDSPRAGSILMNLKSGSPAAELYAEAFKVGQRSELVGASSVATSPGEAVQLFGGNFPPKIAPAQEPIRSLLSSSLQDFSAASQTPGTPQSQVDKKNPAAIKAALDATVKAKLADQAKLVKVGDGDNVFQIPPLAGIISASPEAQKLPFVEKVIAPNLAAGADLTDPNKVFGLAVQGVKDGTVSYQDAVEGMTSLYQRAVAVNLEAKQFASFGLNLVPKKPGDVAMNDYRVQINNGSTFGFKQVVDMTNAADVARTMNKVLARQSLEQFGGSGKRY